MKNLDQFIGCMVGGAAGDAMGFLIQNDSLDDIHKKYGPFGLRTVLKLESNGRRGLVSDDTQMSLFTADGLLWADHEDMSPKIGMYHSYMRWYYTQTEKVSRPEFKGWMGKQPHEDFWDYDIMADKDLYNRRSPSMTTMMVLASGRLCGQDVKMNNSKSCASVMRVAPVGLFFAGDPEKAFHVGSQAGGLTHGHPTGAMAAGAMSSLISLILKGTAMSKAIPQVTKLLKKQKNSREVVKALTKAADEAGKDHDTLKALNKIGSGWVADEALGIAVYCLLKTESFKNAVIMACNHDGDSDSCGAVCGNLAGALYGLDAVPKNWTQHLECLDMLDKMANCLYESNAKNYQTKAKNTDTSAGEVPIKAVTIKKKTTKVAAKDTKTESTKEKAAKPQSTKAKAKA